MKINGQYQISNVSTIPDLARFTQLCITDIQDIVNGRLEFDQNMQTQTLEIVFPEANVEVKIPHKLNKVPSGYLLARSNVALILYDGQTAFTSGYIYLKSNAIGTVKIIVF